MGGVDASSDPAYELLQLFQMLGAVSRVSFDEPAALTPDQTVVEDHDAALQFQQSGPSLTSNL